MVWYLVPCLELCCCNEERQVPQRHVKFHLGIQVHKYHDRGVTAKTRIVEVELALWYCVRVDFDAQRQQKKILVSTVPGNTCYNSTRVQGSRVQQHRYKF